jgi:hypothetical protein
MARGERPGRPARLTPAGDGELEKYEPNPRATFFGMHVKDRFLYMDNGSGCTYCDLLALGTRELAL